MQTTGNTERVQTIIVGAGQAGLSAGYHLKRRGLPFLILDANERIGDQWRRRWDSLRLFTSARYNGLPGMPFPAPQHSFPTKDEMADFLEAYVARFELPVRNGVKVESLEREGDTYVLSAGEQRFEAEHVIVATAHHQKPRVPEFASQLEPDIVQMHSADYKRPSQLREGGVLLVGAGNSASEIAMELSRHGHPIWMSGRGTGHIPFRIDTFLARHLLVPLVLRVMFHRVFTTGTPIGRRMRRKMDLHKGGPLVRVKPRDLKVAGVERVPRTAGVQDGLPVLEDGRVLDVANVIWCTGFTPGFSWIKLPVFGEAEPLHERGVATSEPGLYFLGLEFQYAFSSVMVQGAGRDAEHVVGVLASRVEAARTAAEGQAELAPARQE